MTPELRTITIARELAEEEAATAYDTLSEEILDLRKEVARISCELAALERSLFPLPKPPKPGRIECGVPLGVPDVHVAHQLLNDAGVDARIDEVVPEAVP